MLVHRGQRQQSITRLASCQVLRQQCYSVDRSLVTILVKHLVIYPMIIRCLTSMVTRL